MGRIRQQHPGNYKTSGNISTEFENLYRYLSSAEFGSKTLSEILSGFVDDTGSFVGPLSIRVTPDGGLEYRVGSYSDDSVGWQSITSLASLKGADGASVGDITQSPFSDASYTTSTASQTTFNYAFDAGDNVLVYRSGLLLREGASYDYTKNPTGGSFGTGAIIFNSPQSAGQNYSFFRVRPATSITFIRQDTVTVSSQTVFAYNSTLLGQPIFVYKNGILQMEGGTADYTRQTGTNTITFNTAVPTSNLVTVLGFSPPAGSSVPGLMRTTNYTDPLSGLIRYDRLAISAGQIPNDRVNGLPALISSAARLAVGPTPPLDPSVTRFWIDTSTTPSVLKAWDGSTWLATSVASIVPTFSPTDANLVLKVNATGTAATWAPTDLSSVVPRTFMGAANGVAVLDANGRLPATQLPSAIPYQSIYYTNSGAIAGGSYVLTRIYGQRIRITGFRASLTGGTCSAQLTVSGVGVGTTYTLSTSPVENVLGTAIEVDASSASRSIGISITSPASAAGLEVSLACQLVM